MQKTLEKLSYTTLKDFYKDLHYHSSDSDVTDIEDEIQKIEDRIFTR